MAVNRIDALSAAGIDHLDSKHGKYRCPGCGEYGVWKKKDSNFCKCFAHGGCGWYFPSRNKGATNRWCKEAMYSFMSAMCHYLQTEKECYFRKKAMRYFDERRIDRRVISSAYIGIVGESINPESFIRIAEEEIDKIADSEKRKLATALMEQEFAEPVRMICKTRVGWMAFGYQDTNGDIVAINFRQIEKEKDDKGRLRSVIRMFNPLGYRGTFNPFVEGYCVRDRMLVVEGEFNSLQLLSAYARKYGNDWQDHALSVITVGSSSGVDTRAIWSLLNECEQTYPVVNEDNDAGAGEKVTRQIAKGGFTNHFKLPVKDLDDFIKSASNEVAAINELMKMMRDAPMYACPWEDAKAELDYIRGNPPSSENGEDAKGKPLKAPGHILNQRIYQYVEHDIQTRAASFVSVYPYLFLPAEKKLVRFNRESDSTSMLLRRYGLLQTENDYSLVRDNLESFFYQKAQAKTVHKLGAMVNGSIYVNAGNGEMLKITPQAELPQLVPNGADDVFLLDEALLPWPQLTPENLEYYREISRKIEKRGLSVSDTPLCRHFRCLYEKQRLTQNQCEQLAFTRLMFHWFANSVSLWPIQVHIGEQNSGKSTAFEKFVKLLYGPERDASNMPDDKRSLLAGLTNNATVVYDNIDGSQLDTKQQGFLDIFCGCATGMEASIAELYRTNVERRFKLRSHLKLTARTCPFSRSDAMRRVLQFTIRKPTPEEWIGKDEMFAALMEDRAKILIEVLARLQKIAVAFAASQGKRYKPVSDMPEYECWTYRVAEYEGWLPEMQAIWKAYVESYRDQIGDDNPLIFAAKCWIGEQLASGAHPNVNREVSVTELWAEIGALCERLGIKQTYSSVASFGKHIFRNMTALKLVGYRDNGYTGGGRKILFEPTQDVVAECRALYQDLRKGAMTRLHDSPAAREIDPEPMYEAL